MIEAPEAMNITSQLNTAVKGKSITVTLAMFTPHKFTFFNGTPAFCEELLTGRTVDAIYNYGGMIEIEAGDARLILSDGANIKYFDAGATLPRKHQLLIGFQDETCLVVSVRMYGAIWCYRAGEPEGGIRDYYQAARTKPQVLSTEFTRAYFEGLMGKEKILQKSAKAALATGQAIPGLGNGVLQDILYNAGINPKTKIRDIPPGKLTGLYEVIINTLNDMASKGGRNTETDIFGHSGRYIPRLSKDTQGQPCARCGAMLLKGNYLGGSIYYCSGCQK